MLEAILARNPTEKLYVEDVFQTYLYSGTGSSQTITTGVDLSTNSGMVWIKGRSGATDHAIYDTARGVQKDLVTNSTAAQTTQSTGITAFSSTGFTIGALAKLNTSAATYASWTFRKAKKFFDVVTYTGNGANNIINHSLGTSPGMIMCKRLDASEEWIVAAKQGTYYTALTLNSTAAGIEQYDLISNIANDSTVNVNKIFNAGGVLKPNTNGATYVAYLFAHDTTADGIVQCGSFTTDASGNATVNLGWEPQYIVTKKISSSGLWFFQDVMRGIFADRTGQVFYQDASQEDPITLLAPTATGFSYGSVGATSSDLIYLAIRRGPMRTPTDATKVFSPYITSSISNAGSSTSPIYNSGFVADSGWQRDKSGTDGWYIGQRLTGNKYMKSENTDSEASSAAMVWDSNVGLWSYVASYGLYTYKRAPGFFDIVCYTGTGSARTISHNLGVAPELMIVKNRDSGMEGWRVQTAYSRYGYSGLIALESSGADYNASNYFTTPTATTFGIGTSNPIDGGHNRSGDRFVSYLFASCPGVSKVGSYTGNGSSLNIDCGFTNGARFVLIKRTDSTGDWYVWDTARGIIAGNDPHLSLNTTAAQVTTNDTIDPLSTGFTVNQVAATNVNVNAATYIYLAIA